MPETSLKRESSAGVFLRNLLNFSKNFIYRIPPDDCSCWFLGSKVLFIDHTFSLFPSFYPFITDNCYYGSLFKEGIKMKIFFFFSLLTIIYPKIIFIFYLKEKWDCKQVYWDTNFFLQHHFNFKKKRNIFL